MDLIRVAGVAAVAVFALSFGAVADEEPDEPDAACGGFLKNSVLNEVFVSGQSTTWATEYFDTIPQGECPNWWKKADGHVEGQEIQTAISSGWIDAIGGTAWVEKRVRLGSGMFRARGHPLLPVDAVWATAGLGTVV